MRSQQASGVVAAALAGFVSFMPYASYAATQPVTVSSSKLSVSLPWPHAQGQQIARKITYANHGKKTVTLRLSLTAARDGKKVTSLPFSVSKASIKIEAASERIQADGPSRGRRHSWAVSYELWVPRKTSLDAETSNGSVSVTGVEGRMELRAQNGSITLKNVAGDVFHTYSTYGRGDEELVSAYMCLDLTPKGRNETGMWWRRHDEYDRA